LCRSWFEFQVSSSKSQVTKHYSDAASTKRPSSGRSPGATSSITLAHPRGAGAHNEPAVRRSPLQADLLRRLNDLLRLIDHLFASFLALLADGLRLVDNGVAYLLASLTDILTGGLHVAA